MHDEKGSTPPWRQRLAKAARRVRRARRRLERLRPFGATLPPPGRRPRTRHPGSVDTHPRGNDARRPGRAALAAAAGAAAHGPRPWAGTAEPALGTGAGGAGRSQKPTFLIRFRPGEDGCAVCGVIGPAGDGPQPAS
jgi:hypothetical protein